MNPPTAASPRVHLQRDQQQSAVARRALAQRPAEPGERRGVPGGGERDAARVREAGGHDGGIQLSAAAITTATTTTAATTESQENRQGTNPIENILT